MMKHISQMISEGMPKFLVNKKALKGGMKGTCEFRLGKERFTVELMDFDLMFDKRIGLMKDAIRITVPPDMKKDIAFLANSISGADMTLYDEDGNELCSMKDIITLGPYYNTSNMTITGKDKKTF